MKYNYKHGESRSVEYRAWIMMHERCYDPDKRGFKYYGGRGIEVCDRWHKDNAEGFRNFLSDMGRRPVGCQMHRMDKDDHYTPENCRWATPLEKAPYRSQSGMGGRPI